MGSWTRKCSDKGTAERDAALVMLEKLRALTA